MSSKTDELTEGPAEPPEPEPAEGGVPAEPRARETNQLLGLLGALAVLIVACVVLWWAIDFLRDPGDASRLLVVAVAVVVGVGGVFALFYGMDRAVNVLPEKLREGVRPYVFVGPALVLLSVFLVYPVINTIVVSFKDRNGDAFVGFDNYKFVFEDESLLRSIRNTAAWIVVVPLFGVSIGLLFATLADRLRRGEAVAKSVIFLPMAISLAGATVTFGLIYSFRPEGFGTNVGLLNGIKQGLGQSPTPWLQETPWNNFLLMVIMIWIQTGFAMVVLSAAIKSVPDEIIEAARIDGASELQVFRRIVIPSILPTIVVVTTYMVINALKVFDIVFVSGNAETSQTEVIAERMITWSFRRHDAGVGAAIAVILFLAVIPVMLWNIRRFRAEEAIR
ncbi:MAG TPA: sugar ABC transporter permease [Acidimicrobiales bacterium]|jgi:alpha-glucoside transport system permease protein|nr:sugar ABC transporter permease [Acidimicrobiales bacterium]